MCTCLAFIAFDKATKADNNNHKNMVKICELTWMKVHHFLPCDDQVWMSNYFGCQNTVFVLSQKKVLNLLTFCVFSIVFLNAGSHLCFWFCIIIEKSIEILYLVTLFYSTVVYWARSLNSEYCWKLTYLINTKLSSRSPEKCPSSDVFCLWFFTYNVKV